MSGDDPRIGAFKSPSGARRVARAAVYSWAGLRAAWRYEAAFRQEVAIGVPMIALAAGIAHDRTEAVLLIASIVAVFVVELLNSAVEALGEAISVERHPLVGRAKDLGSAAVMVTLLGAGAVWGCVLWH